jgi:hypothetical protein
MHSSLVEKFSKLVKEHACILEPIINVEDAHPYTRKPINQLTIKQYYGGNEYQARANNALSSEKSMPLFINSPKLPFCKKI